jgi:hypothetical protein
MVDPVAGLPVESGLGTLADLYRHLAAAELAGYCDLYARIAAAAADDRELLTVAHALAPAPKVVPVLLFAAVHDLLLREPGHELAEIYRTGVGDPWPPFRSLVLTRTADLAETMAARSIQTNEVGRCVPLAAALTAVHRATGRPLALVEVGASAGLNLLLDRYAHRLGEAPPLGDPGSPVDLTCEPRGPLRPPWGPALPPLGARAGIDLNPLPATDPAARRWLEACVWPRVPDRPERLRAALAIAAADPPDLRRGDGLALVEPVVDELAGLRGPNAESALRGPNAESGLRGPNAEPGGDTVVCVLFSWALAYLDAEGRQRMEEHLDALGRRHDLVCVSAEYPGIAPWVERPTRPPAGPEGQGATLLGLARWRAGRRETRPLAWIQAHGRWIDWLDEATAEAGPGDG